MLKLTFIHLFIIFMGAFLFFFIGQLIGYVQGVSKANKEYKQQLRRYIGFIRLDTKFKQYKKQQEQGHDQ